MFDFLKKKEKDLGIEEKNLVLDLDSVLTESISFRFNGKNYVIPPIDTETLIRVTNALSILDRMIEKKVVTTNEIIDAHFELFSTVCEGITRKDVEKMTARQAAALRQLVMDAITGRVYTDETEVKKKYQDRSLAH